MSGVALTTISPSSTSSRRNTPCVDGCCGPIEIVICVSSGRSTTSNCGGMLTTDDTDKLRLLQTIWLVTSQRKILAQRVSLPIVRQQNAAQIRMSVEDDAKQIKRLALVPIRGAPHAGNGRHVRVFFTQHDLQTHAMMFCSGEEMIIDFETRVFFNAAIRATDVRQKIEPAFWPGF